MRSSTRLFLRLGIALALFALLVSWGVTGSRLQAAENPAPVQGVLAQANPTPTVDHAAHHEGTATAAAVEEAATEAATGAAPANAGRTVTDTATLTGATPMGGAAAGGMMGAGMMDTMGQVGGMHDEIAAALAALLEENAGTLTPEVAAELGRIQGLAEGMGAMMRDMHGMAGMMQGGTMGGGMQGMMGSGMMGDMPMTGAMPMTATMPMSDMMQGGMMTGTMPMTGPMQGMQGMQGMMGMMHAMQGDMATMMQHMPDDMAAHMGAMHAQMGAMMSMMGTTAPGAMRGAVPVTGTMPMTGTMRGMPGMAGTGRGAAGAAQPFDAQFIDSMIEHHQGAIAMAELALEQAKHEELRAMAEDIIGAQEAEIEQMQEWRGEWHPDLAETQGMGMAMGDMMLAGDTSIPFDRRFIEAMISHHRGAIAMAEHALTAAGHEELRTLAEDIISAQEGEISQLRAWNDEWYPDLPPLPAAGDMNMDDMNMGAAGMGNMAGMHEHMATMMGDMQAMMDEMMADDSMMTPEMAAGMGRMMGRMEGMSRMMGMMGIMNMMQGGMMHDATPPAGEEPEESGN